MNTEQKTGTARAMRERHVVLVVDGDTVSRFYTSVFLQRLNYAVFPVRSAEEALMIMELTVPQLVITEITLPQMSGIDLLKHMKQDPQRKNIPVLVYTAIKGDAQRSACLQAGCTGYLVHTSDHNVLFDAVEKATQHARHFVRLATWLDVIVTAPGSGDQTALITAISEDGMFVSTEKLLPPGTTASFTMHLTNAGSREIRVQGKILHSRAAGLGKSPGMGVMFTQVGPDEAALIKSFIDERLMDGIKKS